MTPAPRTLVGMAVFVAPCVASTEYLRDGIVWPIRITEPASPSEFVERYEHFQAMSMQHRGRPTYIKPHLLSTWLDSIAHSPAVLDAVEAAIGPDILLWSSDWAVKPANQSQAGYAAGGIPWHQDSTYWSLNTSECVSVYFALSPSKRANGAMQAVRGSHVRGSLGAVTYDGDPMLAVIGGIRNSTGENAFNLDYHLNAEGEAALGANGSAADMIELEAGEASMHSVDLLHGGGPNTSPNARVAFVMRFVSSHTRCVTPVHDSAMLVRGNPPAAVHWTFEPRPSEDFSPDALAALARAVDGTPSGFGDREQTPAYTNPLGAPPIVPEALAPAPRHEEL